ncbi:MAG: myxococcus cysteine-rich repeat containing protein, partial [Candidatus Peribacteraceae bacterium]|nr:myxococcus cysteine-rich repeat containing protein [Candidatus Peribacteraceae bacterium]
MPISGVHPATDNQVQSDNNGKLTLIANRQGASWLFEKGCYGYHQVSLQKDYDGKALALILRPFDAEERVFDVSGMNEINVSAVAGDIEMYPFAQFKLQSDQPVSFGLNFDHKQTPGGGFIGQTALMTAYTFHPGLPRDYEAHDVQVKDQNGIDLSCPAYRTSMHYDIASCSQAVLTIQGNTCTWNECGNGMIEGSEQCDDGDREGGDGCSQTCTSEIVCSDTDGNDIFTKGTVVERIDGTQTVVRQETDFCDGTQTVMEYVCTTSQWGNHLMIAPTLCSEGECHEGVCIRCGNGIVEGTEQCDDGNAINSDGCTATCTPEDGWSCSGTRPSVCTKQNPVLRSVVIGGADTYVTYDKAFDTCAHLQNEAGQLVHTQNVFCAKGTNILVQQPLTEVKVTKGQKVKLCHGNNGDICSDLVTVTSACGNRTVEPRYGE